MILYFIWIDVVFRVSREFYSNVGKVESVVNVVNYMNIVGYFRFDLIFGIENVGIILGEVMYMY